MIAIVPDRDELAQHGISVRGHVFWHPTTSQLYEHALARGEARLAEGGALVVDTGEHTGRSPKDKFVVREPGSEGRIWWGDVNAEISEEHYEGLREKVAARLSEGDVYVIDAFAGADPTHRLAVRVITESPWHALFAKTLFIDPTDDELDEMEPQALVLHAPSVSAVPEEDGTRSETFVCLHPSRIEVVIGGTFYAGEIKKSIFTVMNDRLPLQGVFPMHCSANLDDDGRVAIFFGLSGTGKTTLSADPERHLIGDDEHGWSDEGIFNVEGGCYAKVIRLSAEAEPQIHATTRTFGTVLENVVLDDRGVLDLDDDSKTENTRAAYKLEQIANALPAKRAGHPSSVVSPHGRRLRDPPPDREAHAEPGDVLVPLRLHGEARRDGDRRDGAPADVLGLLRRSVPPAAAVRVRGDARCEARRSPRREGLARQHGLDRWAVRRRSADADRRDPDVARRGALGRPRRASSIGSTRRSASRSPSRCQGSTRRFSTRARRGPTPRRTTRKPPTSPGCSARTSLASTTSLRASPPPVRRRSSFLRRLHVRAAIRAGCRDR